MLYMSVYQLIKREILAETDLGRALEQSRRDKELNFGRGTITDPFEEGKYSAAHFDLPLVVTLLQQKIAEARTDQRFILLEGFCNSGKLDKKQSLQLRNMDEFFAIERDIGEVVGVIGLQNEKMPTTFQPESIEEKVEEEVKEVAPKTGDDEEDPAENQSAAGDDKKVPSWKPTDYKWTVTNGKSKNLPQLFRDYMGNRANFEEKNWKSTGCGTHAEAAVKALDDFCERIAEESGNMTVYQQVIFNDLD